jgi:hypothetical protein
MRGTTTMRLDVRSSLFAAVALLVALASGMRIGMYTLVGIVLLLAALFTGLVAVAMKSARVVAMPRSLGRLGLAIGVLAATVVGRVTLPWEWTPVVLVHAGVSVLIIVLLLRSPPRGFADQHPMVALAGLVLPCLSVCRDGVAYVDPGSMWYSWLPWLSLILYGLMGVAVTLTVEQFERRIGLVILLAFLVFGGGIRTIGAVASPEPIIDVWAWRKAAPGYLLQGINPYGAGYDDVYSSERAKPFGLFDPNSPGFTRTLPTYPPLPIYLSVPFAALGLDVRFADVCCDMVAALMIALAGFTVRNRALGIVAAGIYMGFPLAARVIEQSWYEPMLAAMFGSGLVLLKRGYRGGGIFLGLGLVGKQFGVVLAPSAAMACRRHWWAFAVGLATAAVLTLGVFLFWDAKWFLDIILFNHMALNPRWDSLTVAGFVYHEWDVKLPSKVLWLAMILLCGYVAIRTPPCPVAGTAWVGMSLFVFCLFNIQANYNYYYLCVYLLLFGIVGLESMNANADPSHDQLDPARLRIGSPVNR